MGNSFNLHCIFVNNGLLRKNEFDSVLEQYKEMDLNIKGVDYSDRFYSELKGISDPEKKRKIIGRVFIESFDNEANKIKNVKWLAQGTIYPDVIESISATGGPSATIKSHHNVGGLPDFMKLKVIEPQVVGRSGVHLCQLIKISLVDILSLVQGAIRILGDIDENVLKCFKKLIIYNGLKEGLYESIWQAEFYFQSKV